MKTLSCNLIIFYILGLFSKPVYSTGFEGVTLGKTILEGLFYLAIFALAIFLSLYGTRLIGKSFKLMQSSKYMSLIDSINIPGGGKMFLVEINNDIYILGSGNNNISLIDKIDKDIFYAEDQNFEKHLSRHIAKNSNSWKFNNIINLFKKPEISKDKEDEKDEKKY